VAAIESAVEMGQMIENAGASKPGRSWGFDTSIFLAVHKAEEGLYHVAPYASFGKSFLLNDEQLPIFEHWFDDQIRRKSFSLQTMVSIAAVLFVSWAVTVNFLGVLDIPPIAIAAAGLVAVMAGVIVFREDKIARFEMMRTFPFPDAPTSQLRIWDWLKGLGKLFFVGSVTKWVAWAYLVFIGAVLLLFIGLFVFGIVVHERPATALIGSLIGPSFVLIILLLLPLPVIISHRRFEKRTGHPQTLRNLYLHETGRLGSGDQTG